MQKYSFGSLTLDLPQSWQELTLDQYLKLYYQFGEADFLTELSIFSGQPFSDIFCQDATQEQVDLIRDHLKWSITPPDFNTWPVPESINVDGIECHIPKDLELKSYGEKESFQNGLFETITRKETGKDGKVNETHYYIHISTEGGEIKGVLPSFFDQAIARYLLRDVSGKDNFKDSYEYKRTIDEVAAKIRKCSLGDTAPVATFFLNLFKPLWPKSLRHFQEVVPTQNKSKRASKGLKNTVS